MNKGVLLSRVDPWIVGIIIHIGLVGCVVGPTRMATNISSENVKIVDHEKARLAVAQAVIVCLVSVRELVFSEQGYRHIFVGFRDEAWNPIDPHAEFLDGMPRLPASLAPRSMAVPHSTKRPVYRHKETGDLGLLVEVYDIRLSPDNTVATARGGYGIPNSPYPTRFLIEWREGKWSARSLLSY
jgi:hypothetical protein